MPSAPAPAHSALRQSQQHVPYGVLGPGKGNVIAVGNAFARWQERNRAGLERAVELVSDRDAFLAEDTFKFVIAPLRILRVGADEEGLAVLDDPRRELVHLAVERIEQDHTDDALAKPAHMQAPGCGHEASAVADDHHWHLSERFGG